MKTIVTHFSPDVDAICSVWLIRRKLPKFERAVIKFVPAGDTLNNQKPDVNEDIVHVDTGFGLFDHHQTNEKTCASRLIYEYLNKKSLLKKNEQPVLKRITDLVAEIDHFGNVFWPEADSDRYQFFLDSLIDGLKLNFSNDDDRVMKLGLILMDALFTEMFNKIWAEKLLKEGTEFSSPWGKGFGIATTNDEAVSLAQKKGFKIVIRKDPIKGYARIKSLPLSEIDLTQVYNKLKEKDSEASWFLHASKHMVLNGSTKNPKMKPTKLSLEEIIKIISKF